MEATREHDYNNRELLVGLTAWDDQVVAYVYEKTKVRLYHKVYARMKWQGEERLWEDVTECASLALVALLEQMKKDSAPKWVLNWMERVAHNKWVDLCRKRSKGEYHLRPLEGEPEIPVEDTPYEKAFQRLAARVGSEFLPQLDTPCYHLLRRRYLDQLRPAEIAKQLRWTAKRVSNRLNKCRAKLEKLMQAEIKALRNI